jgi:hypothetical protein
MKMGINILLTLIVLGMAYYLYSSIQEPIEVTRTYKKRKDAITARLEQVRDAQMAYRDKKDNFADNFDSLIYSLKSDSIEKIKIIGNPDDTSTVTKYDTTYQPLWQEAYDQQFVFDSLRYIPYSGGKEFSIDAGMKKKNKVKVKVFEVTAPDSIWLKGLKTQYLSNPQSLRMGSMDKGTYSGNWGD